MAMYKKRVALFVALNISVGSLVGCSSADAVPTTSASVAVETQNVMNGEIELSESFVATITPKETTYVFSSMAGIVDNIYVEEGDFVKKGDKLFVLQNEAHQFSLDQAQASYQQAEASRQQAMLMSNLEIESTVATYDQILLAKNQAIVQAENTITSAYASYDQLVAAKNQAVGSGFDMQLLELEAQIETLKMNIATARLQLNHAHNNLKEVEGNVRDAYDDYITADADFLIEDEKLDAAFEVYEDAQIKLATAQILAEKYAALQSSITTFAAIEVKEADKYTSRDGIPDYVVEMIDDIITDMRRNNISGIAMSDLMDLTREVNQAQLDYAEAQADYTQAKTEQLQTEAIFEQWEDGYKDAEIDIDHAQELTYETIAGLETNLKILEEIYDVTKSGATSEIIEVYDKQIAVAQLGIMQAEQALDMVKDSYDEQLRQVQIALSGTQSSAPLIENVYSSQLNMANVAIAQANYVLGELIVASPTNGRVEKIYIEENNPVGNSNAACVIADYSQMEVTFNVSTAVKNTLKTGNNVVVMYGDAQYLGTISEIGAEVVGQTSLFEIKALIDVEYGEIPSGVRAIAYTTTHKANDTITIPYEAVHYERGESFVYVVEEGVARKRIVETGLFNNSTIVITSGLDIDDEIVTTWSSQLRDGAIIRGHEVEEEILLDETTIIKEETRTEIEENTEILLKDDNIKSIEDGE
ncbi:MAG: hypothetical protein ATN36_00070 [Epulopiscium sp. Nele67-Bin005]|nr:MAG: hypothetical protein ATN36_00070 [Epulopiscium sp. Nele67-Bin005]